MKFCLIGERLSHSYSELVHNLCGVEYSLREIAKDELESFVKNNHYDGFNVTIPYKKDIIPFLDELDESAKEISAVNTVVKKDGKLIGYNTDLFGMDFMLKQAEISLKGKNVLVLGTGGAGLMAKTYAQKVGAKSVEYVSRNGELNYNNLYQMKDTEVIINATPVGMYPNNGRCLIEPSRFSKLEGVVDTIYNPNVTELNFLAKECNVKSVSGLMMLVAQGLKAQEIWLNKKFSDSDIIEVHNKILRYKQNIVLIGMPSSGKSTIGKKVAELLERPFIDTDTEIFAKTGFTPKEIIERDGEAEFRKIESQVVSEIGKQNSLVIATGGGSVLNKLNRKSLKQNGLIVYIKRDLNLLKLNDRPISQQKGIETLYQERKNIYESFADVTIENNSSEENCIEEFKRFYENSGY